MSEQFTKREDYTADYTAEAARTVREADEAKGQIHSKKSDSCLHQQLYNQRRHKKCDLNALFLASKFSELVKA